MGYGSKENLYDVVIIGSGPAGYTAAIYAARANLRTLIIAGVTPGGQLMLTGLVENYPGFPEGIHGPDLMDNMRRQAENAGAEIIFDEVVDVDFEAYPRKIMTSEHIYLARTVIIATGAAPKWLGLESEKRLLGRGVSSCATCLPPSSHVTTNFSTMEINQIKEGEKVLTHSGDFKRVIEVTQRQYSGKLVKFRTRFFRHDWTILTPNHPVLVRVLRRGRGHNYWNFKWSKPFWVPAEAIRKGMVVMYPIVKETRDAGHVDIAGELGLNVDENGLAYLENENSTSQRIPARIKIDSKLCRLIGYYLSDGFAHSRGVSFVFSRKQTVYVQDCKTIIQRVFKLRPRVQHGKNTVKVTAYSKILSEFFGRWLGKYSHEKRLPHTFIYLPKRLQAEIVRGVWRCDGSLRKKNFVITLSSRQLVEQLKNILLRLGILPQVEKRRLEKFEYRVIEGGIAHFKHDVYQLVIGGPWLERMSRVLGVRHPRLDSRRGVCNHGWIMDGYALLPISEVSYEQYDGVVYNLTVEEDNTYVTANCVVHNCDGPLFRGSRSVVVVGGGDTAMEYALFLANLVEKVVVIHRRDKLRASKIMQERAFANPKIEFVWNSVVNDILGAERVEGVRVKNKLTGEERVIPCDAVFVAIGHAPSTDIFRGKIELDEDGYIRIYNGMETSVKGVFAAGDVHDRRYRQAVTAAGFGCMAAMEAIRFIEEGWPEMLEKEYGEVVRSEAASKSQP